MTDLVRRLDMMGRQALPDYNDPARMIMGHPPVTQSINPLPNYPVMPQHNFDQSAADTWDPSPEAALRTLLSILRNGTSDEGAESGMNNVAPYNAARR